MNTPDEADILYLIEHTFGRDGTQEYSKSGKVLNQFWWEGLIVTKESLAKSVKLYAESKRTGDNQIKTTAAEEEDDGQFILPWFPVSFNLSNLPELAEFILTNVFYKKFSNSVQLDADIQNNSHNLWIIKRFNGKQSIDYPITSSVQCAVRQLEAAPRLASKYILNPVTLSGKKFDLRYFVFVKSLEV